MIHGMTVHPECVLVYGGSSVQIFPRVPPTRSDQGENSGSAGLMLDVRNAGMLPVIPYFVFDLIVLSCRTSTTSNNHSAGAADRWVLLSFWNSLHSSVIMMISWFLGFAFPWRRCLELEIALVVACNEVWRFQVSLPLQGEKNRRTGQLTATVPRMATAETRLLSRLVCQERTSLYSAKLYGNCRSSCSSVLLSCSTFHPTRSTLTPIPSSFPVRDLGNWTDMISWSSVGRSFPISLSGMLPIPRRETRTTPFHRESWWNRKHDLC